MSRKALDIKGQRFGKLVAVEHVANHTIGRLAIWSFECDCGETITRRKSSVVDAFHRGIDSACDACNLKRIKSPSKQQREYQREASRNYQLTKMFLARWERTRELYIEDDIDEMECDIRALSEYYAPEFLPLYYPAHAIDSEFWPNNMIIVRDRHP